MFVYVIVNHVNGKFYIGKTVSKDLQSYFRDNVSAALAGYTAKPYLYAAIRKYGREAFRCYPLFVGLQSNYELCVFERLAIALFGTTDHSVGYNLTTGGEGTPGRAKSQMEREAISRANKGRKPSQAAIDAARKWRKTHVVSEATKRKNGMSHRGKKRRPGTGALISASLRGKKRSTRVWNKGLVGVQTAWNKGKPWSAEARAKMSAARKGRVPWNKGLKGV